MESFRGTRSRLSCAWWRAASGIACHCTLISIHNIHKLIGLLIPIILMKITKFPETFIYGCHTCLKIAIYPRVARQHCYEKKAASIEQNGRHYTCVTFSVLDL